MSRIYKDNQNGQLYLVCQLDGEDRIDDMLRNMLDQNHIPGFLPMGFAYADDVTSIRYRYSGCATMAQFFSDAREARELVQIMLGIARTIDLAEDYMIPLNTLLLSKEHIFIDIQNEETLLVCLPLATGESAPNLQQFFKRMLSDAILSQREDSAACQVAVQNYLNNHPALNLGEFIQFLNGQLSRQSAPVRRNPSPTGAAPRTETVKTPPVSAPASAPSIAAPSRNPEIPAPAPKAAEGEKKGGLHLFGSGAKTKEAKAAKSEKETAKPDKKAQTKSPKSKAPLYGINIPGMESNLPETPPVSQKPAAEKSTAKAASLFGGKNGRQKPELPPLPGTPEPEKGGTKGGLFFGSRTGGQKAERPEMPTPRPGTSAPIIPESSAARIEEQGTIILSGDNDEGGTIVIDTYHSNGAFAPFLVRSANGERIQINKTIFRIGRSRSSVDYCLPDEHISKQHAYLLLQDQTCYVVDTHSSNHTYLNGRQLESDVSYPLENGDKLQFHKEEFVFYSHN